MPEEKNIRTEQQEETYVMYLNGIDYGFKVEDMSKFINQKTGIEPIKVTLPMRQNSTLNKGFAFATFRTPDELRAAIQALHDLRAEDAQGNVQGERRFLAQEAHSDSRQSGTRGGFASRGGLAPRGHGFGFRGTHSASRGYGFGNSTGFAHRGRSGFARGGMGPGFDRSSASAQADIPLTDDCIIVTNLNFQTKKEDFETYLHTKGIKVESMIVSKPRVAGKENGGVVYIRVPNGALQEECIKVLNSVRMDNFDLGAKPLSQNASIVRVLRGEEDLRPY